MIVRRASWSDDNRSAANSTARAAIIAAPASNSFEGGFIFCLTFKMSHARSALALAAGWALFSSRESLSRCRRQNNIASARICETLPKILLFRRNDIHQRLVLEVWRPDNASAILCGTAKAAFNRRAKLLLERAQSGLSP